MLCDAGPRFAADFPFATVGAHLKGLRQCGFNAAELEGIYRGKCSEILTEIRLGAVA